MATLKHAESRRLYSWWWDSHISPKNSKWLQENLTDMDIKVKAMIKLIEEDADSFARRAEMYYKKRPELMKFVEEFYRAYRALAERYDHATGALRQAHRTMAEAFPNQVPMVITDDSPSSSSGTEAEPHTPEMPHPVRALFDPDDLQKDALGVSLHLPAIKRTGTHIQENDAVMSKKGLKQLNDMFASGDGTDHAKFADGRVRKGLKFQEQEKKGSENTAYNVSRGIQNHIVEENDEAQRKIRTLHDEVSQLSAEKQNLREKVLSESERADKAEDKLESLPPALAKLQSEKEAALLQYKQCLDRVSNLEAEISRGQADFSRLNGEIEEGASKLKAAEERVLLLEKANQSLQSEVDLLVPRTMMQQQEITNKNEELEKLSICIQDERMHLMHAEAALQSLQSLHSQSLEEQRILALELQHGVQMLTEMEFRKQCLEDEILKVKEENHSLSEEKISSSMSIKNLQDEIFSLKEMKGKLEEEVGLRIDQRNALQQELYCLREELNDLDRRHHDVIKQIESVGLNVDGLGSSVKDLQGENLSLKQICKDNENEKAVLSEKLENMEKLLEKNSLLENSLSDASAELEGLRERLKMLEESFQSLLREKSTLDTEKSFLLSQVETIMHNVEELSEKNSMLENSLSDANVELEGLRAKSKSLDESCQVLQDEKSNLLLERDGLISQVETIRQCLENLEKRHVELEDQHLSLEKEKESALHCINELQVSLNLEKQKHEVYIQSSQTEIISLNVELEGLREKSKSLGESCQVLQDEKSNLLLERDSLISQVETIRQYLENLEKRHADIEDQHSCMEKERESALHRVDELQISLNLEKQKHETHIKSSETQLATLGSQIHDILEEVQLRKQQIEEVQDKFMNVEVEIFVFQRCIRDMKERNLLLLIECQEHIEASVCAKKLISELEQEKLKQQMEVNSLLEENKILRTGIHHVLTSLDNDMDYRFHNTTACEELFSLILRKVKDMKNSAVDTEDEKQRLLFEKTVSATLLEQLHLDASVLASEKHALEQESEMRIQELLVIQSEKHALVEMNSQLREHLCERGEKLGILMGEVEILHEQLSDSQKAHQILHDGSTKLHEEKQSLKSEVFNLREENHTLQEENISILGEAIAQGNLSLIFENINSEKGMELKTLNDKLDHLSGVSSELEQVRVMVNKAEAENASLKESLASMEKFRIYAATLENELNGARNVTEELNHKVETGKNLLDQKDMELSQADEKLKAILCENAELLKEISDVKYREEKLNSDLQENINVVKQLEMEAAALYEDLQINSICLALFEEKALELICSCKSLRENIMVQERMFDDERASRYAGNEDLKEKNGALERENGGLNAELSLYLPLILSLKDSIASLEEQTLVLTELHLTDNQETQNVAAASHLHDISGEELNGANDAKVPDGVVELQELQTRIQALEKMIMKSGKVMMQASSITNARLEVATKEIEELKSKSNLSQNEDVQTSNDLVVQQGKDTEPSKNVLNDKAEASKGKNELMMKDIQLDLVSDSSSHHNGVDAYGIRESGKSEADDGMLELWETAEQDSSWEPSTIKKKQQPMSADFDDMVEYHQIEAVEEQKSEYPSAELQAEKELAVDKLELSKKALESKQDGNKRILERLASDARRLTNLQATAQELKKKFEKSEKANQLLGFEYDSVKAQLKEVVEAIAQLVDVNNKLTKNTEDSSASSNSKAELEEKGTMRRRQVSERARRWSEKIGRLELEVQRIQFVMLKLESEYENKGTKGLDRRTRVLLRDYLYGGGERRRRKKVSCCVCMRPTTKE